MLRPEVAQARKQRREMSYPEVLLWQRLRRKGAGAKFRNKHPIGPYVVDFCCVRARLAVEVDGEIHSQPATIMRDRERDRFIVENGYRVIRINAVEILRDADAAAASIASLAALPLHQPAAGPAPRSGEDQGKS